MRTVETSKEAGGTTTTLAVLDRIIQEGCMARDEVQQAYAKDMLNEFAVQILDEGTRVDKDTVAMINHRIAHIDELISARPMCFGRTGHLGGPATSKYRICLDLTGTEGSA